MIEGGLSASPDDPQLLRAAGDLYSFYGTHIVKDEMSARRITQHALEYALRAAGAHIPGIEDARKMGFEAFEAIVDRAGKRVPTSPRSKRSWKAWSGWTRCTKPGRRTSTLPSLPRGDRRRMQSSRHISAAQSQRRTARA